MQDPYSVNIHSVFTYTYEYVNRKPLKMCNNYTVIIKFRSTYRDREREMEPVDGVAVVS